MAVISAPAQKRHVSTIRQHAAVCLNAWQLTADDQHWSLLIVAELAGNAAVHGRRDMTVGLTLSDMNLSILVTDYGEPPRIGRRIFPEDECGRRLGIVCRLAETVDSTATGDTTQIRAVYRIQRPRVT
jgi:anti-sigma regulatory factor (Ser/Thr protein kinase)